jgi:hypothetical protein
LWGIIFWGDQYFPTLSSSLIYWSNSCIIGVAGFYYAFLTECACREDLFVRPHVSTLEQLDGFWLNTTRMLRLWRSAHPHTFQFPTIGINNIVDAWSYEVEESLALLYIVSWNYAW